MSKIFMSYNRESEAMARILVGDLESLGHVPWYDQDLSGGQAWWNQILATIRDSDVFIFIMDPNSLNSTACMKELSYAAALGKPVLPVLVAEGVSMALLPPELVEIQFIDYRKQDRNTALSLARALTSIPPPKPLPDPLPPLPEVPVSYLGGLTRKIDTAPGLTYEDQSALVVELKRSMREPGAADDARTLLKKLRARRDLFAAIAEEIDDLLGKQEKMPPVPPPVPVPQPESSPEKDTPRNKEIPVPPGIITKVSKRDRWLSALYGAVIIVVIGLIFQMFQHLEMFIIIINGIAGAITGAICGKRRKVIIVAAAGFILGFILWAIADSGHDSYKLMRSLAFGASIGAILGAIIGVIINKYRPKQ